MPVYKYMYLEEVPKKKCTKQVNCHSRPQILPGLNSFFLLSVAL